MAGIANESPEIQRFREKLEHKSAIDDKRTTPEKLKEEAKKIKRWLTRHESERKDLTDKTVSLFDENRHSEMPHSRFVTKLALAIKGTSGKSKPSHSLKGRVTTPKSVS